MKDFYKILELNRNASIKEIRKSYRRLALKLHPDVNTSNNANAEFIALGEAYEVLKSPSKRYQYDRLYDYKILNKTPKKPERFRKRNEQWAENVANRKKKGATRSKQQSQENYDSFKKKTSIGALFDSFWSFIELIINFLNIFSIFG